MEVLKYKVIKSATQYRKYCSALEALLELPSLNRGQKDEVELLTLLVETWDASRYQVKELNPIELLLGLMNDHKMKPKDISELLGISKGAVSEMLHYKKGLSKDSIRILSTHFKLAQEAFNRPYELTGKAATDEVPG